MARNNKTLGYRLLAENEDGTVTVLYDSRSHMDEPYKNEEACKAQRKKNTERIRRKASEIVSNDSESPVAYI